MPLDPQDLSFVGSVTVRGSIEEEVRILFHAFKENPVGHSNFHMQLDTQIAEVKSQCSLSHRSELLHPAAL